MDYDCIELEPAANRFFDAGAADEGWSSPTGAPAGATDIEYVERAARYGRELDRGLQLIRFGNLPAQRYPRHDVALPGRTVTVVYDDVLDRRLLEIYVLHGWDGIRRVQEAFALVSGDRWARGLYPWPVVQSFFDYARNRLLLQIRGALVEIERMATADIVVQLNSTAGLVSDAWAALDVRASTRDAAGRQQKVFTGEPSPSLDTPITRFKEFYTLGNSLLAQKLHGAVTLAVQARQAVAAQRAKRAKLKDDLEAFRDEVGSSPPSGMEKDLAEIEQWLEANAGTVDEHYAKVAALCPMAVLAIPLLVEPFERPELDQALGEVLRHLVGEAELLIKRMPSGESWVAEAVPLPQAGVPLEKLFPPDLCVEEAAIEMAMDGICDDPAFLSLLSEGTLARLVELERVDKDSLHYVVLSHATTALMAALARQRRREERIEAVFGVLAKGAALLSLAVWATPAGPVARGVSAALGLGLIAYQAYSVLHQLGQLDLELSKRLVSLNGRSAEDVVFLSELARMRPEYVREMTQAVVTELLLIAAAKAGPDLKQVLHLRGYYLDLEMLVGS